jgi:hypothetical protein
MGQLIMMPVRDAATNTEVIENEGKPKVDSAVDLSAWTTAPKEKTPAYFPTYSTVSKAMQTTLRGWVREWFFANPEVLLRPNTAYPILVYQCTHPFSGRPTNMFTYDIQQTESLNRAFASAAHRLGGELKALDTKKLSWLTREHYFAYRSKEVVKSVAKNRRVLYKMLNVETVLMNSLLKFSLIDIPKMGLDDAAVLLRRAFSTQLRRFSDEFDFSGYADELLRVATEALSSKLPTDNVVEMPRKNMPQEEGQVFELPLAA